MPDLRRYREKRDLETTPEPLGEESLHAHRPLPPAAARRFVVQQHAARSMHWDLRLEIDGVLVSWAVPRGPSLDPKERRLAVQTEDHPLEYAGFEGVIPEGNYGAGAMIVWDRGSYQTADGRSPAEGLAAGKLDLVVDGHKLRGRFALVRTGGSHLATPKRDDDARSWLLLHKDPAASRDTASVELVDAEPRSVLSGLTVSELRSGVSHDDEIAARAAALGAPAGAPDPKRLRPMLAATADAPFSKPGWIFEVKYDGMRVLAFRRDDRVEIYTRNGREVSASYPEIARALQLLPLARFVIDGEIVAPDARGHSSFERLQRRFGAREPRAVSRAEIEYPTVLQAFDLPFAADRDLRDLPLLARKELLARFVPKLGQVRYTDHVEEHGEALFDAAQEHGVEGVMAKRADATYENGRRSKRWLKLRVPREVRLVVVGWDEGRGARRLGSLALGGYRDGALVHAGHVGSGLDDATCEALLPRLEALERRQPAFAGAPTPRPRGAHYVEPGLVADVRYTEVTSQGLLRHPVLLGLHDDVDPHTCAAPVGRDAVLEAAPDPPPPPETELQISRRDKVFWPDDGYTKGDLLDYYESVWPWIAPYLRDRPLVLTRYPDGIEGKSFFQQNAPEWTPEWALHETIDGTDFFVCNELRTLLYVINSGAIPLHIWSSRIPSPRATRLDRDRPRPQGRSLRRRRDHRAPHPPAARRAGDPALREDVGTGRPPRARPDRRAARPRRRAPSGRGAGPGGGARAARDRDDRAPDRVPGRPGLRGLRPERARAPHRVPLLGAAARRRTRLDAPHLGAGDPPPRPGEVEHPDHAAPAEAPRRPHARRARRARRSRRPARRPRAPARRSLLTRGAPSGGEPRPPGVA